MSAFGNSVNPFPSFIKRWLLHWLVLALLISLFCQRSMIKNLFPCIGTVRSLRSIDWTTNLSIFKWWFLFGIYESDYLVEKYGMKEFWKGTMNALSLLYGTTRVMDWLYNTLETFLSGQCTKTSSLFGIWAAAVADGGVLLRTISLRG